MILEEGQRFLLRSFLDAAFDVFFTAARGWRRVSPRAKWDGALASRRALADHLNAFPAEPFVIEAAGSEMIAPSST